MKKYYTSISVLALAMAILAFANFANAQMNPVEMEPEVAPVNPPTLNQKPPVPPRAGTILPAQKDRNDLISKDKVKMSPFNTANVDRKDMKLENQGIRADLKASIDAQRAGFKEQREMLKGDGTNTPKEAIRANMQAQKEKAKEMRKDALLKIQANVAENLTKYITILNNGYTKLQTIISTKSATIKNIEESKALLAQARTAIDKAQADVTAFKNWKPAPSTDASAALDATKEASRQVDLSVPRNLAGQARKSIEMAHQALRKVAISLGLGENKGEQGDKKDGPKPPKGPNGSTTPKLIKPMPPVQNPVENEQGTVEGGSNVQ